jgi:hypothetical protein
MAGGGGEKGWGGDKDGTPVPRWLVWCEVTGGTAVPRCVLRWLGRRNGWDTRATLRVGRGDGWDTRATLACGG